MHLPPLQRAACAADGTCMFTHMLLPQADGICHMYPLPWGLDPTSLRWIYLHTH